MIKIIKFNGTQSIKNTRVKGSILERPIIEGPLYIFHPCLGGYCVDQVQMNNLEPHPKKKALSSVFLHQEQ